MVRYILIIFIGIGAIACSKKESQMEYPISNKTDTVHEYFGHEVPDPFFWLEDDRSAETKAWVEAQNVVTQAYLKEIPYRKQMRNRIEQLFNFERYGVPVKEGDKYYFTKNDGLQNQSVIYVQDDPDAEARLFLDPNTFSTDGTISLGSIDFTEDGSLLAYTISIGGSDWRKLLVMDAASGQLQGDTLSDIKFSSIAWYKNEGFFYSSYDKPKAGSDLSGLTQFHKLYYHKLGTKQQEDKLIFGGTETPRRYIMANVATDNKYLMITAAQGTSGRELYLKDLQNENSSIVQIHVDAKQNHQIVYSEGSRLFIQTNQGAPNGRIVTVDAADPQVENWQDLIPEKSDVLEAVSFAGQNIFVTYLNNASSKVFQYDLKGNLIREVELPGIGTVSGFKGKKSASEVFYAFTSFNFPPTIFRYQINEGTSELFRESVMAFDPELYEVNQVFYPSKDGTEIPMFIVGRKNLELNGKHPVLLYGYGGFNISLTPAFTVRVASWLDMGGVYAVANLRGGGEFGETWHQAGMQMQKQNVFDDFIAAAEYLIQEQYTNSDRLAIMGGSNGGLLVGACMTQRPELFSVALPAVGVLDMLRYHQFTAGAGWIPDYGCADSTETMFKYLYKYSPVHNVDVTKQYPATLITTADHDDRVVPAHSFKFAATLQQNVQNKKPLLIRVETNAGHGAGKPTSKQIEELADIFAFTFKNLGVAPQLD
ncbi:MAG: prolyl oligopeptidase family protein [Cyclobacteriaceae bacterium]